jgi:hypothetical protein
LLRERKTLRNICSRVRAVAAVAAVGADELAAKAEHLRSAQLTLLLGELQRLRDQGLSVPFCLFHNVSIQVLLTADTSQKWSLLRVRTGGLSVNARIVIPFSVGSEGYGERSGEEGGGSGGGEGSLGLTEGYPERVRQNAQGGEVMLEFGDPYREGLRVGVERGEALFELGGAVRELGDLRIYVGL